MCDCSAQIHKYTNYILVRRLHSVCHGTHVHKDNTATVAVVVAAIRGRAACKFI